jgi:hypothetical protein
MRVMNLRGLPMGPSSADECIDLYSQRVGANETPWPQVSMLLTAYMAWPDDQRARDSFMASLLARQIGNQGPGVVNSEQADEGSSSRQWKAFEKFGGINAVSRPAFDYLIGTIGQMQRRWLLVADIFHLIVDMALDDRVALRRGSSVSKAIELCELEQHLPGHSQLRKAWSDFRDVAHLVTAAAFIAHQASARKGTAPLDASILKAIWAAPDATIAASAGFQEFGLKPKTVQREPPVLRPESIWRIPTELQPKKPFVVFRSLTEKQLDFLRTRRAPKKYKPATAS